MHAVLYSSMAHELPWAVVLLQLLLLPAAVRVLHAYHSTVTPKVCSVRGCVCGNNLQVQKMAVDIVSGLCGSPEGIDRLKGVQVSLLGALLRLVPDQNTDISKAALTALVNLSQEPSISKSLLQFNVVGRVMEYIREKSCPHVEMLVSKQHISTPDGS